jgi:hypothetical protein
MRQTNVRENELAILHSLSRQNYVTFRWNESNSHCNNIVKMYVSRYYLKLTVNW